MTLSLPPETIARFEEYDKQEAQRKAKYGACDDPKGEFAQELLSHGFQEIGTIIEGKITRVKDSQDKGKKKTGWYVYHEFDDKYHDGHVIGCAAFGTWRDDVTHNWTSRAIEYFTPDEKHEFQQKRKEAEAQRKIEEQAQQAEAAQKAFEIFDNAQPASPEFAYLQRKQVRPLGFIRQSESRLILPMTNEKNAITSLQYIAADGAKKYHPGGKIKGSFFHIPGEGETVYVVEGYATGASVAMATGANVYCAFMWSNLYEVCNIAQAKHAGAQIVIAGDDDAFIEKNVGRNKATEIATSNPSIIARFPEFQNIETKPTDWNDLHCLQGLDAVKEQLEREHIPYKPREQEQAEMPDHIFHPTGFLGEVVKYYRMTDKRQNDALAIPTAVALASFVCGRNYETNFSNRSSLFAMIVAQTAAGKEHCDRVIKKILDSVDQMDMANVSGYKSATALFCKALDMPRHLCINNEAGKMIKSLTSSQASSHEAQVISAMLEVSTKLDSSLSPPAYATRGLKEQEKKQLDQRVINPAITFLGTTTPDIYEQITAEMLSDGFLNRFLFFVSDGDINYMQYKETQPVPEVIKNWIEAIDRRVPNRQNLSSESPNLIHLSFTDDAMALIQEYERKITDMMNGELRKSPLKNMLPRSAELAMRVALIHALSENPDAEFIYKENAQWAIDCAWYSLSTTLKHFKRNLANSPHEKKRMDYLKALREAGADGYLLRDLPRRKPFSADPKRIRDELIADLVEAGHATKGQRKTGKKGNPAHFIYAIEEE